MSLLSAFAVLIHRYSGQDDVLVGSPIANRKEAQLEPLIGFFVNLLALRVRVKSGLSFQQLLSNVRETTLNAYRYQDVPFERLVQELSPKRRLNSTPLFQTVFILQSIPPGLPRLKGLEITRCAAEERHVRFDLELHATERDGRLDFLWLYNRDCLMTGALNRWRGTI